jgi:multidrug resistance efflux pump
MSVSLWVLSLVSYVCWTAHGLLRGDWVLVSAQVLGVVLSAAILAQAWWYRRKR